MRNYFAIAFTCVYLTLTVGVAKTTHYCMGQEKHSSLFSFTTKKCPCALLFSMSNTCCQDEHTLLKIDDDQSGGPVLHVADPQLSQIGEIFPLVPIDLTLHEAHVPAIVMEHSPPPKIPYYQFFCSLVLYDAVS